MKHIKTHYILFIVALVLIFGGGFSASLIQTNGGNVNVSDVRFQSASGVTTSALLYVPDTASEQSPAPAVLAVHGYINSRETQSAYAIELARRGYVVMSMDQRGHGYSSPPAFAEGFGGPAGLAYLRSLAVVDKSRVALSGHSMGGWTVLSAAAAAPDDYAAIVVSGSSTGSFGVPAGTAESPRNFGLVFGQFDEFSTTMWGSPTGAGIVETDKLKHVFGTQTAVEPGKLYGSIEAGTARKLYHPAQTHPANHITGTGVAGVLDWIQTTITAPTPIEPSDQIWQWKELATLVSLVGGILFLFAFGSVLINTPLFSNLVESPSSAVGIRRKSSGLNWSWWGTALLFVAIPMLTFFPFQGFVSHLPTNAWLSQNLTTGFMLWAVGNGLITTVLFSLWHFVLGGKKNGGSSQSYGLTWAQHVTAKKILLTLALATAIIAGLYSVLWLNQTLFIADFRWWVFALKPMNTLQFIIFLGYVIPFTLFFITVGVSLHGQLRDKNSLSLTRAILRNTTLMGLGMAILLTYQYVPLLMGYTLSIPEQSLLTIVAIQFLGLLPIVGLISTFFFHKTGHVYLGAFVNGMFITWWIVAGQATHYAF